MAATDDSENLLDHLTERINPNGWRVISNPTRRPEPGGDELKTLIRTMQKGRRSPGRLKVDETEPPEAA
jgi:hypothetical protein